jgi:rfaE bifunctional protein nucleotidyltransferase chain/domain
MRSTTGAGGFGGRREGARRARAGRGGLVVFTNGVFDLLHPGHVRYLQDARRLGDALIVGVNSDRSVARTKVRSGRSTPSTSAPKCWARWCVDLAVIFDEDTPHALISQVQPDVLVKGADWGEHNIVGRDIVEARGGRVVRVELSKGFSTTGLIERTRTRGPASP